MNKKKRRLLASDFNTGLFFREPHNYNFPFNGLAVPEILSGSLKFTRKNVNSISRVKYESSLEASNVSGSQLKNENNENLKIHLGYTDNFLSYDAEEIK